ESWGDGIWRWVLSYHIRSMNINNREVELHYNNIEYFKNQKLPRPIEQAENFIRILGDAIEIPSETLEINAQYFASYIGANNILGVDYIGEYLAKKGLIIYEFLGMGMPERNVGLTMEGWEYYENLKSGHLKSNLAFMAMKFNDAELDEFYNNHIKPALEELGFELRKLDKIPKAGLIDNHLRVEIQKSKFILADLTYDNNGAYWEAGYAEGHGKPVIYLCRKDYFDQFKTHFDTNHHTTIIWSQDTVADDMNRLKSTIKNTFPELLYKKIF
ncbi:MAG: hypothetical protein SCK70_15765, partial [bacterium]|nr:hypothetical protein [bacterium]